MAGTNIFEAVTLPYEEETQSSFTYALKENKICGFIDEKQAVEQAIWKILSTERYSTAIYSRNYGVEMAELIGKDPGYAAMEAARIIKEALLEDDRINDVFDFKCEVLKKNLYITFNVNTVFGEIEMKKEVNI